MKTPKYGRSCCCGVWDTKEINLTGAVQNVSGEDLTKRKVSNTSIALQGLIPGVSVMTTSGRPGYDGANIKIRVPDH